MSKNDKLLPADVDTVRGRLVTLSLTANLIRPVEWTEALARDALAELDALQADNKKLREEKMLQSSGLKTAMLQARDRRDEIGRLRAIVDDINALREQEGWSIELIHDNADFGGPTSIVLWRDSFTSRSARFEGESLADALHKGREAVEAAQAATETDKDGAE